MRDTITIIEQRTKNKMKTEEPTPGHFGTPPGYFSKIFKLTFTNLVLDPAPDPDPKTLEAGS